MSGSEDLPPGVHSQALLLPWFLAGTLTEFEREAVSAHLSACRSCQVELEALRASRSLVRDALAAESVARPELEKRVMQAITAERAVTAAAPRAAPHDAAGAVRWWRLAAGVAIAAVAVETVMIAVRSERPVPVVASRALAPERMRIELTLEPEASEATVRDLLIGLHARIVDGPDAGGRYIVELAPGSGAGAEAPLAVLRRQAGVVREARVIP